MLNANAPSFFVPLSYEYVEQEVFVSEDVNLVVGDEEALCAVTVCRKGPSRKLAMHFLVSASTSVSEMVEVFRARRLVPGIRLEDLRVEAKGLEMVSLDATAAALGDSKVFRGDGKDVLEVSSLLTDPEVFNTAEGALSFYRAKVRALDQLLARLSENSDDDGFVEENFDDDHVRKILAIFKERRSNPKKKNSKKKHNSVVVLAEKKKEGAVPAPGKKKTSSNNNGKQRQSPPALAEDEGEKKNPKEDEFLEEEGALLLRTKKNKKKNKIASPKNATVGDDDESLLVFLKRIRCETYFGKFAKEDVKTVSDLQERLSDLGLPIGPKRRIIAALSQPLRVVTPPNPIAESIPDSQSTDSDSHSKQNMPSHRRQRQRADDDDDDDLVAPPPQEKHNHHNKKKKPPTKKTKAPPQK